MSRQEARLLILFIGFMIDSVLSNFISFSYTKQGIMLIPCVGWMFYIFLNHFMNKQDRLVYAIGVGLYYAIIYAQSLLIYVLFFAIISYVGAKYERISSFTLTETLLFILVIFLLKEVVIYFIMKITATTALNLAAFATKRLGPSLIMNAILTIPAYYGFLAYQKFAKERGYII